MLIGKEFLKNKDTQINGVNIIVNIEGITFTQARQFTPFVIKRFVDIIVVRIYETLNGFLSCNALPL